MCNCFGEYDFLSKSSQQCEDCNLSELCKRIIPVYNDNRTELTHFVWKANGRKVNISIFEW